MIRVHATTHPMCCHDSAHQVLTRPDEWTQHCVQEATRAASLRRPDGNFGHQRPFVTSRNLSLQELGRSAIVNRIRLLADATLLSIPSRLPEGNSWSTLEGDGALSEMHEPSSFEQPSTTAHIRPSTTAHIGALVSECNVIRSTITIAMCRSLCSCQRCVVCLSACERFGSAPHCVAPSYVNTDIPYCIYTLSL